MRVIKRIDVVAPVAVVAGALSSVGLMYRAAQFNDTRLLFALFAFLVLSPFVALLWAHMVSKRWSVLTRRRFIA